MTRLRSSSSTPNRNGIWFCSGMLVMAVFATRPQTAPAVVVATADLAIDTQGSTESFIGCLNGSYANVPKDAFGVPVNFGESVVGFNCYLDSESSEPNPCESSTGQFDIMEGSGPAVCLDPITCNTITFILEEFTATGEVASLLEHLVLTIDGTVTFVGGASPSGFPDCPLMGAVGFWTGMWAVNAFQRVSTAVGTDVAVSSSTSFFNSLTGSETPIDVDLTFSNVTTAGTTTVTASSNAAAALASSFAVAYGGFQATFLDVSTTAVFSGPITLCTTYPDFDDDGIVDGTTVPESALSFLHEEGDPPAFIDRTSSRDAANDTICATVSGFSHFVVAVRTDGICSVLGEPCDDGDPCTPIDTCDGTLTCVGSGPPPDCDDGSVCTFDHCVSPSGCAHDPAPATGCLSPSRSFLRLVRKPGLSHRNMLIYRALDGPATDQSQFGDPLGTDGYSICVFDARGVAAAMDVPPGGVCGTMPCWRAVGTKGYAYRDRSSMSDGVKVMKLLGSTEPKTKVFVKGRGAALPEPPLALVPPVHVQMVRTTPGLCFESSFEGSDVKRNEPTLFRAVSP